jgi:hypothetical protein
VASAWPWQEDQSPDDQACALRCRTSHLHHTFLLGISIPPQDPSAFSRDWTRLNEDFIVKSGLSILEPS